MLRLCTYRTSLVGLLLSLLLVARTTGMNAFPFIPIGSTISHVHDGDELCSKIDPDWYSDWVGLTPDPVPIEAINAVPLSDRKAEVTCLDTRGGDLFVGERRIRGPYYLLCGDHELVDVNAERGRSNRVEVTDKATCVSIPDAQQIELDEEISDCIEVPGEAKKGKIKAWVTNRAGALRSVAKLSLGKVRISKQIPLRTQAAAHTIEIPEADMPNGAMAKACAETAPDMSMLTLHLSFLPRPDQMSLSITDKA